MLSWIPAPVSRLLGVRQNAPASSIPASEVAEDGLLMQYALRYALALRSERVGFNAHCGRVARLCDRVARTLGIGEPPRADLVAAADLHEIGMIAVPVHLLQTDEPLSGRELERVRAQASIGAEIVRTTQSERTVWLIEHQYTDYHVLSEAAPSDSCDLLLAGILRTVDVFDTLRHPRPYQRTLDAGDQTRVLREGAGSRFHPCVVELLLGGVGGD